MTKMPEVYLNQILLNIQHIEQFTQSGLETFLESPLIQLAVSKALENIGEMAKTLPPALRTSESGIPWRDIAGLRDIIAHQYLDIDLEAVWSVVRKDLPPLKEAIERIIRLRAATSPENGPSCSRIPGDSGPALGRLRGRKCPKKEPPKELKALFAWHPSHLRMSNV
jgi:uncharacterized protein with HEPN domain